MKIETIKSKEDFINFLAQLKEDFTKDPRSWENKTLADYLEAMKRYAQDVQGYYDNTSQNIDAALPSWKVFADILMGAKVYE